MADLKIVVAGASGRMGRALVREIAQGSGVTGVDDRQLFGRLDVAQQPGELLAADRLGLQARRIAAEV